jgi:PGF-CTERM protein
MRRAMRAVLLAVVVLVAPMTGTMGLAGATPDDGDSSGPPERWTKTVGGADDDKLATGVKVDGGYLAVGWSNSSTPDEAHDGYVAMLDRSGEPKWERTYGDSGTDQIHDVQQVEDGFLLVGTTTAESGDQWNGWLLKIGPEGDEQWERSYSRQGDGSLRSITMSDGQLYVGGWQQDRGSAAAWAMELDPDGERVWSETYDTLRSGTDEYVNSIFVDDGELLMTGSILGGGPDPADAWVLKIGGEGEVKWDETYGGAKYDRVHDAVAAGDGGYVIAGRTASAGGDDQDGWLFKIGPEGEQQWDRTYGTDRRDNFFGIHDESDGGYVLSGIKHVLGPQGADGWIVKTDAEGYQQWEQTYGDSYWDKFWPVIDGHDGGYLAVGDSTSFGDDRQGWVVRVGGPAVSAVEDANENASGTTVRLDDSPVRSVTLADANVSGYVVAEETDLSALSPPGDPIYGVTTNGSESVADATATVEFTVETDSITDDLSDLRVAQRTDDGWTLLETTVASEDNGTAVLAAETDGAATLAVTAVPAPTASIQGDDVVSVGESAELSAEPSTGENAELTEYEWTIDGETMTGETVEQRFDDPGTYEVELTVTDEDGIPATETVTLVVNDQPEVSSKAPDEMTVGTAGTFAADVSNEVGDVTVTWQFASGEVTGETVEHSFGSPGANTVTLVVEDEYGATVTKDVEVEVQSQDDAMNTESGDNDGGIPGFGVGVTLVALLAAALLARRRN